MELVHAVGEDGSIYEETQSNVKKIHFGNVNKHWLNYRLVLHNSSVTAGISFDKDDYFDEQLNVFSGNTCSALSFL